MEQATNPQDINSVKLKTKKTFSILFLGLILGLIIGAYGYEKWLENIDNSIDTNVTEEIVAVLSNDTTDWPFATLTEPGDKMGDFVVVKIEKYTPPTRYYPYPLIIADFTGETTISGPFGFDELNGFCLDIESGNTPEFREFVRNKNYAGRVCLENSYESFKLVTGKDIPLNKSDSHPDTEYPYLKMGSWGKATIVIKDYKMYRVPKDGAGDSATLVRVVGLNPNP